MVSGHFHDRQRYSPSLGSRQRRAEHANLNLSGLMTYTTSGDITLDMQRSSK